MPHEYAVLIVLAVYLVGGLAYAHWIHRPRKPNRTKHPEGGTHEGEHHRSEGAALDAHRGR
ncbi:hypothetical protein CLV79_10917 [Limimaricola soesokkakensis]|uniref:Uncharacterized protein n=1 Tax=Limimaricola soesokkakensis TaxID=1343159 RepID=A0A1X6ZRY4_9RHOB|nr:hypothetical protein CLV79_10917 [Limimaricola soesokkakensis]SLN59864.1 hypothetical protein LOS8367_02881 [Limimaricola soesokkakensis]